MRAGGDAAESFIELVGDRPLSFTTLKLRSPPRVVVDFAETDLALPLRDLAVDDGTIRRVAAAPAGQKTARVVIELAADAEFAVRAQGNTIEVRVPRIAPLLAKAEPPKAPAEPPATGAQGASPAGRPAEAPQVAAAEPPPPAGPRDEPPQVAAPSRDGAPSARAAESARPVATAPAKETPPAVAPAATAAVEPPGRSEAAKPAAPAPGSESQKRASLPTVALVGSRAAPPPPAESAAARKRREKDERVAAYASAQRAAAEKAAAAHQAARERRLAAAEQAAADQRAISEKAAAARKSAREGKLAAAEKAAADAQIAAERAAADRQIAAERGAAAQKARKLAAVERRRAAADHRRKLAPAAPRHSISGIGFRPEGDGQVIVRSDHPLEYGVSADGNAVVLHLTSAVIPLLNNRRALDTHYFNGPVQRVVPLTVDGGTDLRIELREHADYQLAQSGGVLTVTFSVPR